MLAALRRRVFNGGSLRCRRFRISLIREGVLNYPSARDVQAPKAGRPLPQVLSVDQMTALNERPKQRDDDRLFARDRAIMELF
jgi:site-specific recombinase XerC